MGRWPPAPVSAPHLAEAAQRPFRLLNGLIEGGKTRPGEHAIGGEVIAVTTHALDELELALRMSGKRNVPDQMSEQQRSDGQK